MAILVRLVNLIHSGIQFVTRRLFLLAACCSRSPTSQPLIRDPTLLHSATELASKIRNRQLSSEEVVKCYIDRIKEVQPIVNCMAEDKFEDALQEAKQCDELLRSLNAPSAAVLAEEKPFFGVPFTIKEYIAVENMKQTIGLVCRKNCRAEKDADAVRLMRSAGAIALATTNVCEHLWWESSNYVYGTSRNPYNTRHTVGGSSGGEAGLLAAAGSPCGLGSDQGGSIRMPSFFNGIFGHKPSKGVVSYEGHYPDQLTPEQYELLTIGPMSRFAEDLAPMLQVLADKNADILKLQTKVDIKKLKIYYMEDDGGEMLVTPVDSEIKESLRRAVDHLELACHVKAEKVDIGKMKNTVPVFMAFMASQPGKDLSYELTNRKGQAILTWEFLKKFTCTSNHTLVALVAAAVDRVGVKYGSEKQKKLMQEGRDLQQEFADLLGEDGIFLYPTHPTAAPLHHETIVKPYNFSYTGIFNVLGLPVTACPLGLNRQGLPIGIQVVAGLNQDRLTLAIAEELQREFGGWVSPAKVV